MLRRVQTSTAAPSHPRLIGSLLVLVLAVACGGRDMTEDGPGAGGGGGGGGGGGSAATFDTTAGPLDSDEVYFHNDVGLCEEAVSPAVDPNTIAYGFDCAFTFSEFRVDPIDGGLVYVGDNDSDPENEVLEWVSDSLSTLNQELDDNDIPSFAPCPDLSGGIEQPDEVRFSPDGSFFYHCVEGGLDRGWFDGSGTLFYDGGIELIAVADGGIALLRTGLGVFHVFERAGGTTTEVMGLLSASGQVFRGLADGFWVVNPDPAGAELWMIDEFAVPTLLDTYPPYPADFDPDEGALDAVGDLYRFGIDETGGIFDFVLLRAETSGSGWTELFREDGLDPDRRVDLLAPGARHLFSGP